MKYPTPALVRAIAAVHQKKVTAHTATIADAASESIVEQKECPWLPSQI